VHREIFLLFPVKCSFNLVAPPPQFFSNNTNPGNKFFACSHTYPSPPIDSCNH
jgi:hypothetical protein